MTRLLQIRTARLAAILTLSIAGGCAGCNDTVEPPPPAAWTRCDPTTTDPELSCAGLGVSGGCFPVAGITGGAPTDGICVEQCCNVGGNLTCSRYEARCIPVEGDDGTELGGTLGDDFGSDLCMPTCMTDVATCRAVFAGAPAPDWNPYPRTVDGVEGEVVFFLPY